MNAGESTSPEVLVVGADLEVVRNATMALPGRVHHVPVEDIDGSETIRQHVDADGIAGVVVGVSDDFENWGRIVEAISEPRSPPVLVVTTESADREHAVRAGADDVFVRPLDDAEMMILRRRLDDLVRTAVLRAEYEERNNLLDHIFNQVPSALYIKDEEGRHLRKRNFEHDPQEYFGKTDLELYPNDFGAETFADDMRVIEKGERIINKEEYNPNTGDWTLTSKVPWRDDDGEIKGLIGVSRLITEKKEYEQELRLRNRAIEAAPIGITIHDVSDDSRSIQFANEAVADLTGYDRSTIEGGTLRLFEGPETDDERLSMIDAAFENVESESVDTLLYRRDRTPFWVRVSIAPVTDDEGAVTHFVGFLQDVTDRKEHEQTIERRLDEFGDLLDQQLGPPLRDARAALESIPDDGEDPDYETLTESIHRIDTLVDELADVNTFDVKSEDVSEVLSEHSED